jgi:class 3 adenylate cyclase
MAPDTLHLIRTSTGTQLAWLFFFVSLMPMCVLGGSVYVKLTALHTPERFATLGLWMSCLIGINTGVSVVLVTLMSRRVRGSLADMLGKMQRVLDGDLSDPWRPRTTDEFLDLGIGFNAMLLGLRERETIKDTFGRFVSQDVADAVLGGKVPLQGERRQVTILFQDIRGFTTLSEKTSPEDLLQLVNAFFTEMVAAVEAHGGIVRQFTGDGVMALFGAPVQHADEPIRAVRAGLDMLVRLATFNQRRQACGQAPLYIGIGIHTGDVVAGCVGPDKRLEYSVVGDAVNLASRVQDLTKAVGTALLITDDTAAQLSPDFKLGRRTVLPVRGKTVPIGVIEVLGVEP